MEPAETAVNRHVAQDLRDLKIQNEESFTGRASPFTIFAEMFLAYRRLRRFDYC